MEKKKISFQVELNADKDTIVENYSCLLGSASFETEINGTKFSYPLIKRIVCSMRKEIVGKVMSEDELLKYESQIFKGLEASQIKTKIAQWLKEM